MNLKYRSFRAGIIRDLVPPVERIRAEGIFHATLRDRPGGRIIGETQARNLLPNVSLQYLLNTTLMGGAAVVGPYMGLLIGATAAQAGDSMATVGVAGREAAGAPARLGAAFVTATTTGTGTTANGTSNVTTPPQFQNSVPASETITGAFIVTGTGAVATRLSTAGTLFSEGLFAAGQAWSSGQQLTVSYSVTLSSP